MKIQNERNRLIKEVVKFTAIAGVCLAVYLGASMWASSVEQSKTQNTARTAQLQTEITNLRTKVDSSGSAQKIYTGLVESRGNEDFEIDNEKVRAVLQELVKRHRISISDKLEYSAERDFKHPELTTVTTPIKVRQEAKLRFAAISDLHVYAFMQSLSRELPGIIKFTQFKITRKVMVDEDAIAQLALGRTINTVEAEVTFDWFGFVHADDAGEKAKEATP